MLFCRIFALNLTTLTQTVFFGQSYVQGSVDGPASTAQISVISSTAMAVNPMTGDVSPRMRMLGPCSICMFVVIFLFTSVWSQAAVVSLHGMLVRRMIFPNHVCAIHSVLPAGPVGEQQPRFLRCAPHLQQRHRSLCGDAVRHGRVWRSRNRYVSETAMRSSVKARHEPCADMDVCNARFPRHCFLTCNSMDTC
jgi:hypothetical protein